MKTLYNKLSTVTIILFLAGMVVTAYYLYNTSANIANALQIRKVNELSMLEKVVRDNNTIISIELVLAILAIGFLLVDKKAASSLITNNKRASINTSEHTADNFHGADAEIKSKKIEAIQSKLQASYIDNNAKLDKILSGICHEIEACQGAIFQAIQKDNIRLIELCASYAYFIAESKTVTYEFGESLTGQVAKEGKLLNISSVPEGYVTVISGLGNSSPKHLIIAPIKLKEVVVGIIEIASFKAFTKEDEEFLTLLSPILSDLMASRYVEETTH